MIVELHGNEGGIRKPFQNVDYHEDGGETYYNEFEDALFIFAGRMAVYVTADEFHIFHDVVYLVKNGQFPKNR